MANPTDRLEQKDTPLFSVCIPTYEDAEAFSRCLESVCTQKIPGLEIIVSDDSRNNTITKVVTERNDTRIRYRRNTPGLGAPANWNAALMMSTGARITLLHQDDWYRTPNALAEVNAIMDERHADVLISGRAIYGANGCQGEYRLPGNAVQRFLSGFPASSLVINRLGHPAVFFLSGQYRSLAYDKNLLYFSDTDYYYRLLKAAKNAEVYPKPIVAISWQNQTRLSSMYINEPQKTLAELFFLHEKYIFTSIERGTSAARLCASHVRHWYRSFNIVLKTLRQGLPRRAFIAACFSIPLFLPFMAYRLVYRLIKKKGWG